MSWVRRAYREVDADASRTDHAESPARAALLTGVLTSGVFLLVGLVGSLLQREVRPDVPPHSREVLEGFLRLRGSSWLYLGLLILAATPVLRVVVMAGVYLRRRERFMLTVSLIVLGLLAASVILGTG